VKTIKQKRGEAISIQADVSDPKAVGKLFRQLDAAWNGIDILINNAGFDGPSAVGWKADMGWNSLEFHGFAEVLLYVGG
jgi:NADP-dependent 3-hydroxy acid dehydrogenase YdfG